MNVNNILKNISIFLKSLIKIHNRKSVAAENFHYYKILIISSKYIISS
jgi:hypothetical protein